MAYLNGDSNEIVIDAIVTKRGRELMAEGKGNFKITKYAFSDDGVDYGLWNPNNQNGTNYYGQAIENMPIQEAIPNQDVSLAYKLVSLAPNSTHVTYLANVQPAITLDSNDPETIRPTTQPIGADDVEGYKATIMDGTYATLTVKDPVIGTRLSSTPSRASGMNVNSESIVGKSFYLTRKSTTVDRTTTIEIEGNASGAKSTITVTIKATATAGSVASLAV